MTNATTGLRSSHWFGRSPFRTDTVLQHKDISNVHGLVQWNLTGWEIFDLSRNGIKVNGVTIGHAPAKRPLERGDRVQFGVSPDTVWIMEDVSPPATMLVEVNGSRSLVLKSSQLINDGGCPAFSIYLSPTRGWVMERGGVSTVLRDGDVIDINGRKWEFVPCPMPETTIDCKVSDLDPYAELKCRFTASLNEEHVELLLETGQRKIDLGERVHHYCLLLLARKRIEDSKNGFDSHSQGWIELDALARMIGQKPSYINIQIFRLRNQIARAFATDPYAPDLIERRRNELRIGTYDVEIYRG